MNIRHIQSSGIFCLVLLYFIYIVLLGDDLVPFNSNNNFVSVKVEENIVIGYQHLKKHQVNNNNTILVYHGDDKEKPQGWHPEARRNQFQHKINAQHSESRMKNRPYKNPERDDPGDEFLPFPEEMVDDLYKKEPKLIYDVDLIRMSDDFGLIDDNYTVEELSDIFTKVIEIYAKANIYIRMPKEDLLNIHKLTRIKSLQYLAYVEGPDFGEYTDFIENKNSHGLGQNLQEYNKWYYKEWKKVINRKIPLIESFVRSFRSLKKSYWVKQKSDFKRNFLDWIIGFPHLLTPWQIMHSTPMFPLYSVHIMNGECRAGKIVGRTSSCWNTKKVIIDKANNNQFIKNMTCRGYIHQIQSRYKMKKGEVFVRDTEKRLMYGAGAARMWAHEIGHSLSLHHPSNECNEAEKWEDNQLMMQQRYVGVKGIGCPETPTDDQAKGVAWTQKQINIIRKFIMDKDIKQSRTIPNGITIGDSTEQLGARSIPVFRRFILNRANFIGNGKNIRRRPCDLPKSLIVFRRLPSPFDGYLYRIRWLPSKWNDEPFRIRVFVVSSLDIDDDNNSKTKEKFSYEVTQRSDYIEVPKTIQKTHIELDLVKPLLISKGQMVMIASENGKPIDIDQQLYDSENVLYGDISGKLPQYGPSFHNEILQSKYSEVKLSYPELRINRRQRSWFVSSKHTNKVNLFDFEKESETGSLHFFANAPSRDNKDAWCLPLIFNYDIIPDYAQ